MSIYDEIVEAACRVDPTAAPGKLNHPDDCRAALERICERRAAGERIRAEAMADLAVWIPAALAAGLTVSEVARLAGVTRQTVYDTLRRD